MGSLQLDGLTWKVGGELYRIEGGSLTVPGEPMGNVVVVDALSATLADVFADIVVGISWPFGGEIRLDHQEVTSLRPGKRGIGLVPPGGALFPHKTIGDNIAMGLSRPRRHKPVDDNGNPAGPVGINAGRLGLIGFLERYPHDVAPDERLRVALARALTGDEIVGAVVIEDRDGHPPSHAAVRGITDKFRNRAVLVVTDNPDRVATLSPHPLRRIERVDPRQVDHDG